MTARFHISLPQIDPAWERPTPSARELRTDVLIWVLVLAISLLLTAAYHSTGLFGGEPDSVIGAYLASAGITLPLILRRRYPLTMLLTGTVLFFMLSLLNSIVAATMSFQFIYLAVIYSAIAWAKNRAMLWVLFTLICLSVLVWLASLWAINGASFSLFGIEDYSGGLFSLPTASYIATFLANLIYFSCGMLVGRVSWRAAYQQALLQEQQVQLEEQAQQLADSAVTRDRLRIARELHDSVGHHVSAMGIQAAAARRALNKKPELASAPLEKVEDLARSSVTEMKSIIRVLRSDQDAQGASGEPGIADLTSLIESLGDAAIKGQLQFIGQSYAHLNQ
ncbi:MAG: histidine kinase dimerization/phosphoacceptor domain-containing protein, partial [Rothia sp. (in: high G+C Gram-positive bacteria)]|nr:histidine kinase dimerization/phosphoacceptor domain-containing protein [Rothia sp. (in: high G+C Gram-positive bacteria)]